MSAIALPATTGSSNGQRVRVAAVFSAAAVLVPFIGGGRTSSVPDTPPFLSATVTAAHLPGVVVGDEPAAPPASAVAIRDLKRRTALTWEELARMFGVSRRTVHNWGEGAKVSRAREMRLHEIAAIIADFPGAPEAVRGALRSVSGGRPIIDIIAMGAPAQLISAHLAGHLGPPITRVSEPAPPPPRLREARSDPQLMTPRALLASGALSHLDQEGTGDGHL